MYPDKVKHLIIGGVHDTENYHATLWNSNLVKVDEAVSSLFEYCHQAGPEKCALYGSTPGKIRERYFNILESLAC